MQLKTHGDELAVMRGRAMLSADYTPGDRGPGKLALEIVDQETFESKQAVVHLDPWRGNVYEVIEWPECEALLLCGAPQMVIGTVAGSRSASFAISRNLPSSVCTSPYCGRARCGIQPSP